MAEVFNSAIQCLQEEDRQLPFIQAMLPMLQAGVAVHHSGAAPERTLCCAVLLCCALRCGAVHRSGACPAPAATRERMLCCAVLSCAVLGLPCLTLSRRCSGRVSAASRAAALGLECVLRCPNAAPPPLPAPTLPSLPAGLLPILKELVEILFQEQLVKVGPIGCSVFREKGIFWRHSLMGARRKLRCGQTGFKPRQASRMHSGRSWALLLLPVPRPQHACTSYLVSTKGRLREQSGDVCCRLARLPAAAPACPAPCFMPPPMPVLRLQCLFSTETFAMGLNMPARTCVFTALRKWDGEENRRVGWHMQARPAPLGWPSAGLAAPAPSRLLKQSCG